MEMRGVWKQYGRLVALRGVDLELRSGEVHAVLGENGAGKTTLMSVLGGMVQPDSGEIAIDGVSRRIRSPKQATRLGIGMVHQHFRLVERFSVAENLHVGARDAPLFGAPGQLVQRAEAMAERFKVDLDVAAKISDLSVGEQQLVEILRVLSRGADIVILDEPTAVLTPQESDALFATLRSMADRGSAVLFITHKLREVVGHADVVTILRRGSRVASVAGSAANERDLARVMIGRELRPTRAPDQAKLPALGDPEIVVERLSALDDRGLPALRELSLTVRGGEIVGVAGVAGNGQRELAQAVTGQRPLVSGSVHVGGRDLSSGSARDFIDGGVGHVPEDRMEVGLVPSEAIWRNVVLKSYRDKPVRKGPCVGTDTAKGIAGEVVASVNLTQSDVRCRVHQLSGGNAQRLLIGRELHGKPRVLVAANPSRGVDVGAGEQVRDALLAARADGMAILLISEDLDEIMALSDRVVALYEGAIVGESPTSEVRAEEIGLLIGGGAG
jgi:general nucleoside transport system ATP-binding protein